MNQHDFEALWANDKSIIDDIAFAPSVGFTDVYSFDDIEVLTEDINLRVNGSYSCRSGALSINFTVPGLGSIHRYDLGGNRHGDGGRYHQHIILTPNDVRLKLPNVVSRNDLMNISSEAVWQKICNESSITHTATFFPPEVLCP